MCYCPFFYHSIYSYKYESAKGGKEFSKGEGGKTLKKTLLIERCQNHLGHIKSSLVSSVFQSVCYDSLEPFIAITMLLQCGMLLPLGTSWLHILAQSLCLIHLGGMLIS